MASFTEFESAILAALPQERSELQSLQGESEAQLSAWVEHLFRDHLGYTHFREISREGGASIGARGTKQLFPDLRINILDNGLIFIECKKPGRLDGPKGQEELTAAESQLMSYIRAHWDQAAIKPKTVLGVVTDGNRWRLIGLNRANQFHTIAEWAFLTDDPRLIAQRLWLLAKPALAQPTSALVEFLARRTLVEVLKERTKWLTKQVNEKLPDGAVSQELIGKWLREAFAVPDVAAGTVAPSSSPSVSTVPVPTEPQTAATIKQEPGDVSLADVIRAGVLAPPVKLFRSYKGTRQEATLLADGAVEFQGQRYETCSGAGEAAKATVTGQKMNTNGWDFWQYLGLDGKEHRLSDARDQVAPSAATGTSGQQGPQDRPERHDLRKKFWQALLDRPKMKDTRHAHIAPGEYVRISAGSGVRGLPFVYAIGQREGRVELFIDRGADEGKEGNKRILDQMQQHKGEIEVAFGSALSWQPLDGKRACRISYTTTAGGYRSDEAKWPAIQDAMIDAMGRLEKALAPQLEKLKTELTS